MVGHLVCTQRAQCMHVDTCAQCMHTACTQRAHSVHTACTRVYVHALSGGFSTSSSGGFTSASELLASGAGAGADKRRAVDAGEKARGGRAFF